LVSLIKEGENIKMKEFFITIQPAMSALLVVIWGAFLTVLGVEIKKQGPGVWEYVINKLGSLKYARVKEFASDLYYRLEEAERKGTLLDTKINLFGKLLRVKFPKITDPEIIQAREALAGVQNMYRPIVTKVIADAEAAADVKPAPVDPVETAAVEGLTSMAAAASKADLILKTVAATGEVIQKYYTKDGKELILK